MSRGKRYDGESKLNLKKVIAVIVAIAVIIMFIFIIKTLLSKDKGDKLTSESYFVAFEDNKYGVINSKGETVIEPSYSEFILIPNEKKDVFLCTYDVDYIANSYKTKVLNAKNEEIFKDYEQVEALDSFDNQNNVYYQDSMLKVKKDGKIGLISLENKEIVPCEYDSINTLRGVKNSFIVVKNGKQGLVDSNGKLIVSPEYKEIKSLGEDYKLGYIIVNNDNKYGVIDYTNKIILENKYEDIKQMSSENIYGVKENGKWKLVNTAYEEIGKGKLDDIKSIEGNNIIVIKSGKYGVINNAGEEIIPTKYEDISFAFTDSFIVKKGSKFGLVKGNDQLILEIKYDSFDYIKGADFAEASEDGINTDVIGNDLNIKVSGIISEINIPKGYFKIRVGDDYKYYNFKFEEKKSTDLLVNNTLFLTRQNGKYGYSDIDGKIVVKCEYDDATEQNIYGYLSVKKDGKWGSIDKKANIIVEPIYNLDDNIKVDFIGKWHIGQDLNMNYYTK